jgi:nicotinate-nucleotide adenylyltransferase
VRVGLFGGSFNPVHNTHIRTMRTILAKKLVDEIWIVPCKNHAFNKSLLSAQHRVVMLKLAIKSMQRVKICTIELEQKRKNHSLQTIRLLRKKYPFDFSLIVGSDILRDFKRWYKYETLLQEAHFIVFKRKNYPFIRIKGMRAVFVNDKEDGLSSTTVRQLCKEGKSLKSILPSVVEEYIKKKKLYT